ncbi:MAG: hypothetical protein COS14_08170 [Bacteroidetes bacterium CG02_land_8_20_14_3_00_31_25]|nr:DUF488 domain-containing protein [Bacteroidota bacterium]PIV58705.1 MAG: hypothetical protein COS14_08170 [Bacteroidetes bacterium CG02_land_8_20_14_3_00_31_25]PIX36097.1 MAG: hypothetical protein COZ59_02950 [Bacteroidetes bacterium CG_4_8_14_3_um_filter_31_14]PIY02794.1 MAG: hypothetical protein COZ21_12330 [Bacteroidetes bacterium CG_4_10_14_3_um_filter_31_20]
MEFFTIGVYNSTEKEFFEKLTKNNIDTFCDIRQRRGVRGAKYSFVNSNRLQQKLNELEIKYGYVPELAPTSEIRGLQKEIDLEKGELKRERHELGKVFVIEFKNKILKNFDFETFIEKLDQVGANRVAFFCVEEFPEACHRSIVTDRLTDKYNYKVTHL